jgi:hypothetical protein
MIGFRVAAPTIPELAVHRDQTYSERRRCGRRPSEVRAAQKSLSSNRALHLLSVFSNLNPKRQRGGTAIKLPPR